MIGAIFETMKMSDAVDIKDACLIHLENHEPAWGPAQGRNP